MNPEASAPMDTDNVANNIASLLQSLSIADDACDGSERSTVIPEASASLGVVDNFHDSMSDHVLQPKHKIFLSHSGSQKSFVADLYADLKRRDRHSFFDIVESCLPIGEKFPNLIFDAIKQCQVGVVVLSEEFFTKTKWPMLELMAMFEESKKPDRRINIIPIFYTISREMCCNPSVQAKWMTNDWKKWEEEDKARIDLVKWKGALSIFGSRTGIVMKDGMLDRDLRAKIVEAICKEVLSEASWDDSHVAGKTRLCREICQKIFQGSQPKDLKGGTQVVGLYGMGGHGKTTACKILCKELSTYYNDKVCHVELGSRSEEELLQKALKLLSNLDVDKFDDSKGYDYLKSHIVKERVFLALDNVLNESKEQAKKYLKAKTNFGAGSIILVTSRSIDQLLHLDVHKDNCFAMLDLELEEARSLFLGYANLKEDEIDKNLLEKCIKRCYFFKGQSSASSSPLSGGYHYHPLALEVLGSEVGNFIRHDRTRQGAMLSRIDTFNLSRQKEHPVFSILRSSFDSLKELDQLLFLHITLFIPIRYESMLAMEWLGMVHGKEANDIEWMLECLKRRSLLESFDMSHDSFSMHDLWREFASNEVEDGQFKAQHLLYKNMKCSGRVDLTEFPKMGVVKLLAERTKDVALDVQGLKYLKSLDITGHQGRTVVKVNGLGTLENLTYLRWTNAASNACIAELGQLTNLQGVYLVGFQGDKLPDMSKLTNLRFLNLALSHSLQSINLRNLTNLMQLELYLCTSLESVELGDFGGDRLPDVGKLTNLRFLDLDYCESLKSINLRNLTNLMHLRLYRCTSLESVDLGDFGGDKLPDMGKLTNLRILNLRCSKSLQSINLRNLTNLMHLDLYDCTSLRSLDITGCSSIEEVMGLDSIFWLEELRATKCKSLPRLPYNLRLPRLRVLEIEPEKPAIVREPIRRFKKH